MKIMHSSLVWKRSLSVCALLVFLIGSGLLFAQRMRDRQVDPLARVKQALNVAGAPALTSGQEEQLNSVITAHRTALQALRSGDALQQARRAYQNAILSGDSSAAQAQSDLIATETANLARARLKENANFQIAVLNVLKSNDDQIGLLQKHSGSAGLSRLLGSLSGRGGPRFGAGARASRAR